MEHQGPRIAQTPLELLTSDEVRELPYLDAIWGPTICSTMALAAVCFGNYAMRRPLLSGIQRYVIAGGAGLVIGKFLDNKRMHYYANKDAILRHYIELHPEDFPAFERTKYADLFEPWIPIR